jgi:hypothetical protein
MRLRVTNLYLGVGLLCWLVDSAVDDGKNHELIGESQVWAISIEVPVRDDLARRSANRGVV